MKNINDKIKKWLTGMEHSFLTRKETYISLMTSVTKTITYSFTTTSLSNSEMHQISTPIYKMALPRMGILPTLPLPYRYASSRYQGMDFQYLPVEQLVKKIEAFLYHGNQATQVGKSLTMCLEDIQIETGLLNSIFS